MADDQDKVSTTALARQLDIPAQQLFATLKDYGWIQRVEDNWVLTGKGEFEGGSYVDSKRYGRYIVWPKSLESHQLLKAIESNQRISASGLRRYYPKLHPRQINRALAELGLQAHSVLGWELTEQAAALGDRLAHRRERERDAEPDRRLQEEHQLGLRHPSPPRPKQSQRLRPAASHARRGAIHAC